MQDAGDSFAGCSVTEGIHRRAHALGPGLVGEGGIEQFAETLGLPWRRYLLHARMLRAMALLAAPGQSVQETSTAVGFDSLSAFSRAFTQFCGETPSTYRKKVGGGRI